MELTNDTLLQELRAFGAASQQLNIWSAGAQAVALLRAALAAGLLAAAANPQTVAQLAFAIGLDEPRVADLCLALDAHGIFDREGVSYRVSTDYAALLLPTAFQRLPDLLERSALATRTTETSASPDVQYTALTAEDALAMARGAAPHPASPTTRAAWRAAIRQLPELHARWEVGARHLELGCGAGNGLLGVLAAYPRLTAVGVDLSADVLAEAHRRAVELRVADRLELRHANACDFADSGGFDSAFWAQQFFAADSRDAVLARLREALRPGGYLLLPTAVAGEPPLTEEALRQPGGQAYALARLRFGYWGLPYVSADALQVEAEGAGFVLAGRTLFTGRSLLLMRRAATT